MALYSREEAEHTILKMVSEWTNIPNVKPDAKFVTFMDSLDTVELIMNVEDEFGIEISDEDAEKLHSVNDYLNYLATRHLHVGGSQLVTSPSMDNIDPRST